MNVFPIGIEATKVLKVTIYVGPGSEEEVRKKYFETVASIGAFALKHGGEFHRFKEAQEDSHFGAELLSGIYFIEIPEEYTEKFEWLLQGKRVTFV